MKSATFKNFKIYIGFLPGAKEIYYKCFNR